MPNLLGKKKSKCLCLQSNLENSKEMRKKTEKQLILEQIIQTLPDISVEQADKLYSSSKLGGELGKYNSAQEWLNERFLPNVVILTRDDYILALTQALRIAPKLAGTDFGTTRQRDLGQLWTDTARGFLGEIAFARLLNKRFGLKLEMDYSVGAVSEYLNSDVKSITDKEGVSYELKYNISIKTTKFNGIWLDIPGAQISHSNVFFLIKLGIEREHFVSFLKDISFVKDKLLPQAILLGAINQKEADELWESLPIFRNIACYVCGFIDDDSVAKYNNVPCGFRELFTREKVSKDKFEVSEYIGWIRKGKPDNLPAQLEGKSEFTSIGNFTASNDHFISNIGLLKNSESDWRTFLSKVLEVE